MMLLVNAALRQGKQGDVAAVKELRDIIRDDDMLKHKIKYDNARLRLEKQKLEPVSMPDKVYSGYPCEPCRSYVLACPVRYCRAGTFRVCFPRRAWLD